MALTSALIAEKMLPDSLWRRSKPLFEKFDGIMLSKDPETLAERMSLYAFVIRVVAAAIAFLSQILMARWLGQFEYGILVLVWTYMVMIGGFAAIGFDAAMVRFVPEYRETGQFGLLHGVLRTSKWLVIMISTLVALLGAVGIYVFENALESYYVIPFYLGLITIPMLAMTDLANGVGRGQGWMVAALAPTHLIRPILILVFLVAAVLAGAETTAKTALLAAIAATWLTTIGTVMFMARRNRATMPEAEPEYKVRHWITIALPMFLVEGFYYILTNADVLMVGIYMEPKDIATYFAAAKCLALIHFVYFAVRSGAAQRYATLYHGSADPKELEKFARATVHWTFWPSLALGVVMLIFGEFVLSLFGEDFIEGYPLLFILVIGIIGRSAFGPCESLLTMSGNERICVAVFATALVSNVVLNMILIPLYGLTGAAIATATSMLIEATLLTLTVYKRLGIAMIILPQRSGK